MAPRVGFEPTTYRLTAGCSTVELSRNTAEPEGKGILGFRKLGSGGDLLSQGLAPQVPSALEGLTAVFGMGTGGTPPLFPPEKFSQN